MHLGTWWLCDAGRHCGILGNHSLHRLCAGLPCAKRANESRQRVQNYRYFGTCSISAHSLVQFAKLVGVQCAGDFSHYPDFGHHWRADRHSLRHYVSPGHLRSWYANVYD